MYANASFEVVRRFDPAIDPQASDWQAFIRTGDVSTLAFFDGETPTRFTCRRLRRSEVHEVQRLPTDADRYEAAFARGVMRIEGLRIESGRTSWVRPDRKTRDGAEVPLSTRELDAFAEADVLEVGAAVLARSLCDPFSPVFWPAPDTSLHALKVLEFHRAAQTRAQASSSPQSNPPVEGQPPAI